jgi:hypothetical protein
MEEEEGAGRDGALALESSVSPPPPPIICFIQCSAGAAATFSIIQWIRNRNGPASATAGHHARLV